MCRGGNLRIGLKVSVVDGLNQLLSNFDDFLFAGWNTEGADVTSRARGRRAGRFKQVGKLNAEKKEHSLLSQFQMGASLPISRTVNGIRNGRFFIWKQNTRVTFGLFSTSRKPPMANSGVRQRNVRRRWVLSPDTAQNQQKQANARWWCKKSNTKAVLGE